MMFIDIEPRGVVSTVITKTVDGIGIRITVLVGTPAGRKRIRSVQKSFYRSTRVYHVIIRGPGNGRRRVRVRRRCMTCDNTTILAHTKCNKCDQLAPINIGTYPRRATDDAKTRLSGWELDSVGSTCIDHCDAAVNDGLKRLTFSRADFPSRTAAVSHHGGIPKRNRGVLHYPVQDISAKTI